MAHHDDMVVAMKPGEPLPKKPDGTWEYAVVGGGVAQFANNRVTILADFCGASEDIDEVRARGGNGACAMSSCARSSRSMSTVCRRHPSPVRCHD